MSTSKDSKKKDPKIQLKLESMEKAKKYVELMRAAKTDPTTKIDGEVLEIWSELESWGMFEHYPIEKEENMWLYITILAMTQHRHLLWQLKHPEKKKLSKWEVVMGRSGRRI